MQRTQKQAVIELLFAGILWGFSFIAARWALGGFGPFWVCTFRFLAAFVMALFLIREERSTRKLSAQLSVLPGLLLGITLLLQTRGLQLTTVTKSSFLTTLYIVFIPLFDWIFFRNRPTLRVVMWIVVALVGAALITKTEYGSWNRGDLLTLICAVTSAWQILHIGRISQKVTRPFLFNAYQSLFAGLISLPFAVGWESLQFPTDPLPWIGILFLAIGVCLIAFTIQIRVQKILPSTTVSMFFLLESPIATFFAWLLFNEVMTWDQFLGAGLIIAAAAGTLTERKAH